MKRHLLLLFVLAGLLSTSCVKDAFDELDALSNGIEIGGTVSPTLGVPIGYGSASIHDLLNMIQETDSYVEIDDHGVISITYDTIIVWRQEFDNKGDKSAFGNGTIKGDSAIVHTSQKVYNGSLDIDLFENLDVDTLNFEIDSLLFYLGVDVIAEAEESTLNALGKYHVHVYYDSIYINVLGKDDNTYPVANHLEPIDLDSIIHGQYIKIFDYTDIRNIINKKPRKITYSARMTVAFEAEFFDLQISTDDFISDSIGINAIVANFDVRAKFPVSFYVEEMSTSKDMEFSSDIDIDNLIIDSSFLSLEISNGLPLGIGIKAYFLDENSNQLCSLFEPEEVRIYAAQIAMNPAIGRYTASSPTDCIIKIPINKSTYEYMKQAKFIRITASLSTSSLQNVSKPHVTILESDKIDFRAWAKVKITADVNELLNGSNEEGGKK